MRLTRTQEDAHREVLAIVEARTVVHRDAVAPYLEESILTLRALIPGSGKLHHPLNTRTGHRARVPHKMQRLFEGGAGVGERRVKCRNWITVRSNMKVSKNERRQREEPKMVLGCLIWGLHGW